MTLDQVPAYINAALFVTLAGMAAIKYRRERTLLYVALFAAALLLLLRGALVFFLPLGDFSVPAGLEGLEIAGVGIILVGFACHAAGGFSPRAAALGAPLSLGAGALVFGLGYFEVFQPEIYAGLPSVAGCILVILGMSVVFLGGPASPHYAFQFLLFYGVSAGLGLALLADWDAPAWLSLAAAGSRSFAFLSLIFFAEAVTEQAPAPEKSAADNDVRGNVFSACTRIARNMKELDTSLPYEQWFSQGMHNIASAVRDVMGYQHISLAQLDEGDADAQAVSGFLMHNGHPHELQVFLGASVMEQVMESQEPLVSTNARMDPRLTGCRFDALNWNSVALMPLNIKGGKPCLLVVGDRADGIAFDEDDVFAFILLRDYLTMFMSYLATRGELYAAASMDPVTLQQNYSSFQKIVEKAMADSDKTGGSFALVLFDIDRFFLVNEKLGFERGDEILRELGERIKRYSESGVVGRVGSDEFAILLRGDAADVRDRIEIILRELNQTAAAMCQDVKLSISAGFTFYPYDFLEQTSVFGKMREALAAGSTTTQQLLRVKCN
jgi:diguanylate cyclase (GGDEF)-like protein